MSCIEIGKAKVPQVKKKVSEDAYVYGWGLPGGRFTRNKDAAIRMAEKINIEINKLIAKRNKMFDI